jgi:hypothetical protein
MKVLTLAAGFAAGAADAGAANPKLKAGREKYEEIATTAREVSSHPTLVQVQEKAKSYLQTAVKR